MQNKLSNEQLQSRVINRPNDETDPRGIYFRDATAILHCTAFRRLRHKTQVFFAPSNDHICTRLEHVLHVSSIAVTICRALDLNTDLAWAIGMGHDLGHTPFGHLGETVLEKLTNKFFSHELHSLRVVDIFANLNLSYAVRDGIVTHCGEKFEQFIKPCHKIQNISSFADRNAYPASFEGCVVRMADKIAYLGRDYEDAITLKLIEKDSLPLPTKFELGTDSNSSIINTFVTDLITYSKKNNVIGFSENIYNTMKMLKDFNYSHIYKSKKLLAQSEKFEKLLTLLYEHLYKCITKYKDDLEAFHSMEHEVEQMLANHIHTWKHLYDINTEDGIPQLLTDFIANMTDDFVITSVKKLLFV